MSMIQLSKVDAALVEGLEEFEEVVAGKLGGSRVGESGSLFVLVKRLGRHKSFRQDTVNELPCVKLVLNELKVSVARDIFSPSRSLHTKYGNSSRPFP